MIAQTHFNHFILSLDTGENVVLDDEAKEVDRFKVLEKALNFAKDRHLTRHAADLTERVETQRAERLAAEAKAAKQE
jgi:hypothetical protein